ncbi:TonB-dependent receptor [Spongiibacter sp. KMU-158]|uniref:TonB-dependent receptor n=1 Tax=Spongiibacter pelagi TaxID=2760804 RepID=A0A927C2J2_9GAMM|nr:TonB-dependent receptor [Spongiibacter pelagi]MBD2860115.1 TonB-dependent receptor [Spongiibacter pelagi]
MSKPVSFLAILAVTSFIPNAFAQTKPRMALEEVVVTAQKREEDVQSVPLSVTAIGGDDIVDKNMGDMNEVANYVPNLDILAIPSFPSIYMRGLGSSYNRGFEQSVAILIDEVFYGRASYITQGLMDLSAIEVLRGPQGTLFGKNSSAGAIHFRTAQPEHEFGVNGDVLLGENNLQRYRVTATGPLTESLTWRLALMSDQRDGSIDNTTTGIDEENRDTQGARLRLNWDATDSLSIGFTLNGGVVNQHGPGTQLIAARGRALAAMQAFDPQTDANAYDERNALDHPGMASRETWDSTVKVDWSLGGGMLTSISNYTWMDEDLSFDADFSPIPFLILDNDEDLRQFSQELRFTSAPGKFEYVAGLYYMHTDLSTTYDITEQLLLTEILQVTGEGERMICLQSPDPKSCQDAVLDDANSGALAAQTIQARLALEGGVSAVETSFTHFNQVTDSAALFGQANWHLTKHLTLTFGSRFNYEEKTLDVAHTLLNNRTGQTGNAVLSTGGLPLINYGLGPSPLGATIFPFIISGDTQFSAQRQRDDFNIIPKASLQYAFDDDVMSYITVARGYKSGGFNAQPVNDKQLEFDEEDALTYEVGLKSEWLSGAARLNLAAFRTEFDGLQVATFNGVSYVVGNAASATIQGLEYEAMLLTRYGILLGINGAYTDAYYDEFKNAPCDAEVSNPPPCDLSGKRLRLVPELKTTLTAGYQGQPFGLPFQTILGFTASYSSDVALATDLDPIDIREASTVYGLQAGIKAPDESWHLMLFGDNITNHEYLAGAQDAPAFRGTHFGGAYPAVSYELELGFRF